LYTSQSLRDKLHLTMAGPGMMRQRYDYLDHSWNPFDDGRCFEYSTIPWDHVAAFTVIAEDLFNRYAIESIREEVFRLQDLFLQKLDRELFEIQYFELKNRSGIISISPKRNTALLLKALSKENIVVTERGGYVRLAPHFYLDDNQLMRAAETFNRLGGH
ncbi:MAG: hypothetical protein KJO32_16695, partial [Deltaproteobacteria bacterium]|nr:hypothetical protein [Deltaproteobacteria bacterium]